MGIDLSARTFIDLSQMDADELMDVLAKSIMWMESLNNTYSLAKKYMLDEELEMSVVLNRILSRPTQGRKVAEAKAEGKADPEYISANKRFNLIASYVDYLERILVNLDKFHYVIKAKLEYMRSLEYKYRHGSGI